MGKHEDGVRDAGGSHCESEADERRQDGRIRTCRVMPSSSPALAARAARVVRTIDGVFA